MLVGGHRRWRSGASMCIRQGCILLIRSVRMQKAIVGFGQFITYVEKSVQRCQQLLVLPTEKTKGPGDCSVSCGYPITKEPILESS